MTRGLLLVEWLYRAAFWFVLVVSASAWLAQYLTP